MALMTDISCYVKHGDDFPLNKWNEGVIYVSYDHSSDRYMDRLWF